MTLTYRRGIRAGVRGLVAAAAFACLATPAMAQTAPLDHFKCYITKDKALEIPVVLRDQFDTAGTVEEPIVRHPVRFCNPVEKTRPDGSVSPIINPNNHLTLYLAAPSELHPKRAVRIANQFHQATLQVFQPETLATPTQKDPHEPPARLDHFKCYRTSGPRLNVPVALKDQFLFDPEVMVLDPFAFCNPTEKVHDGVVTPIQFPEAHLLCYRITAQPFETVVLIRNQFIGQELLVTRPDLLCVPTRKLAWVVLP